MADAKLLDHKQVTKLCVDALEEREHHRETLRQVRNSLCDCQCCSDLEYRLLRERERWLFVVKPLVNTNGNKPALETESQEVTVGPSDSYLIRNALEKYLLYGNTDSMVFREGATGKPVSAVKMLELIKEGSPLTTAFIEDIAGAALKVLRVDHMSDDKPVGIKDVKAYILALEAKVARLETERRRALTLLKNPPDEEVPNGV